MIRKLWVLAGVIVAVVAMPVLTHGQEEQPTQVKETSENKPPETAFREALKKWRDLNRRLDELKQQFAQAKTGEQRKILDEYNDTVFKTKSHLYQLRETAEKAYRDAPNNDESVTRVLIALMANSNAGQDYQTSLRIGKLLAENQCPLDAYACPYGVAAFCTGDEETGAAQLQIAEKIGKVTDQGRTVLRELDLRRREDGQDLPRVKLSTTKGDIELVLFEKEAPQTVGNFISLIEEGFYDGLTFHRVIPGFVAQGGCPKGDGSGGPGYEIYCECHTPEHRNHFRGSLSMAHAGKDTGGSQFYLVYERSQSTANLDGKHTVFGRVVKGMEVVDKLQDTSSADKDQYDRISKAEVLKKREHKYEPTKVQ